MSDEPGLHPEVPPAHAKAAESTALASSYIRSMLQISVPVAVELATTKQPVSRILSLGPGSIIQFDRNCDQPLTLRIGNQAMAQGEAVKVGDKFGIKIISMALPHERFVPLRGTTTE